MVNSELAQSLPNLKAQINLSNKLQPEFVNWFRHSSPYINAHRHRTFVVTFSGHAVNDPNFAHLVHDIALLSSLGVKLVLVHGAREQIEADLAKQGLQSRYHNGIRITDETTLNSVKAAVGAVRLEIEARFSAGIANSPMAGANIRIVSGNFVIARPKGIHDGVDYCHTGEVRRIDTTAIRSHLDQGHLVLLSPIGYSPTGEIFNLHAEAIATQTAIRLEADKLLFLAEQAITDHQQNTRPLLSITQAETYLQQPSHQASLPTWYTALRGAVDACRHGITRTHIINRHYDGALLQELFTRNGIGTLITTDEYDKTRQATIDDVGGILELIEPLEQAGILVKRSRERLEMEIDHFTIVERDGMVIACAALYPFINDQCAELACLAVHKDYQRDGYGQKLLDWLTQKAINANLTQLFVMTSRTAHWFIERGFVAINIEDLPVERKQMYNYQRRSKVFAKPLTPRQ